MPIVVSVLIGLVMYLNTRIVNLEHACGPVYTGGGVTQCSQPNTLQAPPTP